MILGKIVAKIMKYLLYFQQNHSTWHCKTSTCGVFG